MNKINKTGLSFAVFAMLLGGVTLFSNHTKAAHAASPTTTTTASESITAEAPETANSSEVGIVGQGHQDGPGSNVDHQFNGVE
jgi:hypothetical protein